MNHYLKNSENILKSSQLKTAFGNILVIGSETALYFLEFCDSPGFQRRLTRFEKKIQPHCVILGTSPALQSIEKELNHYFEGKLKHFDTPLVLLGTPFQKKVWETLKTIPFGDTLSYTGLAEAIGNPLACRAVANANACNHIAIVIPCHRVIQANGSLGGYGGGKNRKKQLLDLEGASYTNHILLR